MPCFEVLYVAVGWGPQNLLCTMKTGEKTNNIYTLSSKTPFTHREKRNIHLAYAVIQSGITTER